MVSAFAREGRAVPVAPSLSQRHSGHPSHQVQLGWPYVAMRRRERRESVLDHPKVMRDRDLLRKVVVLETDVRWRRDEQVDGLAGRETLKRGDVVLDDETAAGLQVRSDVAETFDLLVLGGQVRDRVAQKVCERERSVHLSRREIADRDADVGCSLLLLQLGDHGGRELDPVHGNSPPAERQRDASRTDAELEGRAASCQVGEEVDGRVDHRRIE